MILGRKRAMWVTVAAIAAVVTAAILLLLRSKRIRPVILEGAVIRQASREDKELPLSGAEITASDGSVATSCKSDSSGFFKLVLPTSNQRNAPVKLMFRHPEYQPLDLKVIGGARLYVAKMIPTARPLTRSLANPIQGG